MKLDRVFIEWAIDHIVEFGDTDIFPPPFEVQFFKDRKEQIVSEMSNWSISSFRPISLIESLLPKSKLGYRVVHQIYLSDLVFFLAIVLSISEKIESNRFEISSNKAFSYRISAANKPAIFDENRRYKNWIDNIKGKVYFASNFEYVIKTDISDFYARIYRHRLENIIKSFTGERQVARAIESVLSSWRGGQSFGIPVGSAAGRILAEIALSDIDNALTSEGYEFTRYVDDFIIFVKAGQNPHAALSFLAYNLSICEGLSLNSQKTSIFSWKEFVSDFDKESGEDDKSAEESALQKLYWAAYNDKEDEDSEALEKLRLLDLQSELEKHINDPFWDMSQIRILLKALSLTQSELAAIYVKDNFSKLIPFSKEIVLFIQSFCAKGSNIFDRFDDQLIDAVTSNDLQYLDCSRAWLLELGVRGLFEFSAQQLRRLDQLTGVLDKRQLLQLRMRARDLTYFRARKTKINEETPWTQPAFIYSASCLPKDEYMFWLNSIKSRIAFPLHDIFIEWCRTLK